MKATKEYANAKINLFLDVVARRSDGFHDIKTVMHTVSLCDEIAVFVSASKERVIKLLSSGSRYLPNDEKNLAYKAAELFMSEAQITAQVDIKLEKRIPIAAGLAGGSSDAAAVLRAMNRLFNRVFSDKALYKLAESLGSDVPFCLYGKTALCEGRGEILTKLPDTLKLNFVIVSSGEHMSTPKAYQFLDEKYSNFDGSIATGGESKFNAISKCISMGDVTQESLFNVFENVVLPQCEKARQAKDRLLSLGASAAMMSGSGPSVFGIFRTKDEAENACNILKKENYQAYTAISV